MISVRDNSREMENRALRMAMGMEVCMARL